MRVQQLLLIKVGARRSNYKLCVISPPRGCTVAASLRMRQRQEGALCRSTTPWPPCLLWPSSTSSRPRSTTQLPSPWFSSINSRSTTNSKRGRLIPPCYPDLRRLQDIQRWLWVRQTAPCWRAPCLAPPSCLATTADWLWLIAGTDPSRRKSSVQAVVEE